MRGRGGCLPQTTTHTLFTSERVREKRTQKDGRQGTGQKAESGELGKWSGGGNESVENAEGN